MDPTEPHRLAEAVSRMNLKHVVITSVNRDDLDDGGASQFFQCVSEVRKKSPETTIEPVSYTHLTLPTSSRV